MTLLPSNAQPTGLTHFVSNGTTLPLLLRLENPAVAAREADETDIGFRRRFFKAIPYLSFLCDTLSSFLSLSLPLCFSRFCGRREVFTELARRVFVFMDTLSLARRSSI